MRDAEFRRRAHAILTVTRSIAETFGGFAQPERDELDALLTDGASHRTCDCSYPWAHRPDCPDSGRMWPAVNIDLPPARKDGKP